MLNRRAFVSRAFLCVVAAFSFASLCSTSAAGQGVTVVHSFAGGGGSPYAGLAESADGTLYGATAGDGLWGQGSVFSLTPDGGGGFTFSTLHSFTAGTDGANPEAALVLASDGNLYGTTLDGFVARYGTVFRIDAAGNLTTLYEFTGYADGAGPTASLVQASDGNLYGVTQSGGSAGYGTIFRIDLAGALTTLHSFTGGAGGSEPRGALVEGPDGKLYGTTFNGDNEGGQGTVFRIALDGTFENLHNFSGPDGLNPAAGLVVGPDGFFYGTTQYGGDNNHGTVFRMDDAGAVTAFSFDGSFANPVAPLIVADDGNLYGTAPGAVYRLTTSGSITSIHVFSGLEASWVLAPVLQAADGKLYGTTVASDTDFGRVFRLDLDGQNYEIVHAFTGGPGARAPFIALLQGADGNIYGTSQFHFGTGAVFRLDPQGNETLLHAFSDADGGLATGLVRSPDGALFGTAAGGGTAGLGAIFQIDTAGTFSVLHEFADADVDGSAPLELTLATDGTLYGTTTGGPSPFPGPGGSIWGLDSGGFSTRHVFDGGAGDPSYAFGDMLERPDGTFIGVSLYGGASDLGSLFRFDPDGSTEVVHSFEGWDGAWPPGPPVVGPDGNYYGVTQTGGTDGRGTIYRLSPSGRLTSIHSFTGPDGISPIEELVLGHDGYLYGATRAGGASDFGTVFRADSSGDVTTLHSFSGFDGKEPLSELFEAFDGGIYGATTAGGLFGYGEVFRVQPPPASSVWGITPSSGPASGGTAVTISGFHFYFPALTIGGADAATGAFTPTSFTATTPALAPGTLNDLVVTNFDGTSGTLKEAYFVDFTDVAPDDIFHSMVESAFRQHLTAGCGGGLYCRDGGVTRAQMAVFLLHGKHGGGYVPPACSGVFADVACPGPFTDWIEQLSVEGITSGCGGGSYCPDDPVTRAQMAVFLLKARHGSSFTPPACAGIFGDVTCPSLFADWIEQLYSENVTGGCQASPLLYCPGSPSTRGQMAVFLVKAFALP